LLKRKEFLFFSIFRIETEHPGSYAQISDMIGNRTRPSKYGSMLLVARVLLLTNPMGLYGSMNVLNLILTALRNLATCFVFF
jgi:hypothetical protein